MKRTYKYALTVVLGVGLVAPAFAQEGFADVKDTHWAADAVNRLKIAGFIHGERPGFFNGDRNITRYEMASMVYAVYGKLVCFNEEIEKKIKTLEANINNIKPADPQKGPDYTDIKSALADIQREVGSMKAWSSDIAQLKKMSAAYANELKSLGVDIDTMKKNISDVAARVAKLEKGPNGIMISGDANFWMAGASTSSGTPVVVNQDGRFLIPNAQGAGMDTLTVLHELGVKIEDPTANVPYKGVFVAGNTINGGFGTQAYDRSVLGTGIPSGGPTSVYVAELTAMFKNQNLLVGRQGMHLNKFVFRRADNTSFFSNERWDNGNWSFDGGTLFFGSKNAGRAFFGTLSNMRDTLGQIVQPVQMNTLGVSRIMGITYDFNFSGDKGKIAASFVNFDGGLGVQFNFLTDGVAVPQGGPPTTGITRYNVYGADLNYDFGSFQFSGGGGKSVGYGIAGIQQGGGDLTAPGSGSDTHNLDTLINSANGRWEAALSSKTDSHSFRVAYRNVEANYAAPGDWGRVSIFRNLVDTKALSGMASLNLSKKFGVRATYEKGDAIAGVGDYKMWRAGVGYDLTAKWEGDLMYENTTFNGGFQGIANGSTSKFATLRLGYDLGEKTMLHLFWQNADLVGILPNIGRGEQKGNFFGCQFSVKF